MPGVIKEVESYAWVGKGGQPHGAEKVKAKTLICEVPRGEARLAKELCAQHGAWKVGIKFRGGGTTYRDRKGNKLKTRQAMLAYLLGEK